MPRRCFALFALVLCLASPQLLAAEEPGLKYDEPKTYQLKMVLKVEAQGAVRNVQVVGPTPIEWPEQKVKLISQTAPPGATVREQVFKGQAGMVRLSLPSLSAGQTAVLERTFEITRSRIKLETPLAELKAPKAFSHDLREHLGPAPGVEIRHPRLVELAKELKKPDEGPAQTARRMFDWVRENVQYENDQFRGALFAVEQKRGDCEEMSALFVALCRLSGVPARTVWVEGHDYPEFYAVDGQGQGLWIPVQLVGPAWFAEMGEFRPIFQKGDSFTNPFNRQAGRHVPQTLTGVGSPPKLFVENHLLIDGRRVDPNVEFRLE